MKPSSWLWAVAVVGLPLCIWRQQPTASADPEPLHAPIVSRFVGAASCSASACHNANFAHGPTGSEFTHWMTRDRHAKAYEVLFEPAARQIQTRLGASAKPHQDQRCLKCHVHPEFDARLDEEIPFFKTDGVSCESCHGPARRWLTEHYLPSWKTLSTLEKQRRGMADTQSAVGRVQTCVPCHVGAAGMEVDHDLIAAGHPRLHFEFTAFHAQMPRHWPDAKDRNPNAAPRGRPDFESHAWSIGQVATARASLALLAERASNPKSPWPEFAEYDCTACHHDLQHPPREAVGKSKPGTLPWENHLTFLTPIARDRNDPSAQTSIDELHALMNSSNPKRTVIAAKANAASRQLDAILRKLETGNLPAEKIVREAVQFWRTPPSARSEAWTQLRLSLIALRSAGIDVQPALPAELQRQLPNEPTPSFEPAAIRKRLAPASPQDRLNR